MEERQKIAEELSEQAVAALVNTDDRIQQINAILDEMRITVQDLQELENKIDQYNEQIDLVDKKMKMYSNSRKRAFLMHEVNEKRFAKELKSHHIYTTMIKARTLITDYNKKLEEHSKTAYKELMSLRQLLTKQIIVYEVSAGGRTWGTSTHNDTFYNVQIGEDEYLDLLKIKPSYNKNNKTNLDKLSKNFSGKSLLMDYQKTINKTLKHLEEAEKYNAMVIHRDDKQNLFNRIMYMHKNSTSTEYRFRPSAAWEAYTEARAYFTPEELENLTNAQLLDFLSRWEKMGTKRIKTIEYNKQGSITEQEHRTYGTASLTQYGDTMYRDSEGQISDLISIQNKRSSSAFEAGVSISTVYNALKMTLDSFALMNTDPKRMIRQLQVLYSVQFNDAANGVEETARSCATDEIEQILSLYIKNKKNF